jgi:hypothetical protein
MAISASVIVLSIGVSSIGPLDRVAGPVYNIIAGTTSVVTLLVPFLGF